MLKKSNVRSLTLWKTDDVNNEMKKMNELARNWKNGKKIVKMEVYDVKEMYTCLPHKIILEAVRWITNRFKEDYGEFVTVVGNRSKDVKIGRIKSNRIFHREEIVKAVKQDLENAVFRCGNILVIQTIGIPMGSPLSPALAIISCAIAEEKMKNELQGNIQFQAMRYMDDVWVCTIRDRREKEENINQLFAYYDRHLKVEKEREGNRVRFLDREVIWDGECFKTINFNKNLESLRESGTRKFLNILPQISYNSRTTKKAIIVGKLARIQRSMTKEQDIFWQG